MSSPTKEITDFELFKPNLIGGTPIEYAYTFKHNNLLIQKATYDDLIAALQKNWTGIGYVKTGKDEPSLYPIVFDHELAALKSKRIFGSVNFVVPIIVSSFLGWDNYDHTELRL